MRKHKRSHYSIQGYTLIEILVTVILVGILAVVGLPNWFNYINEQKLNQASEATETLLRTAQNRALQEGQAFQVEFRNSDNIPQASLYRTDSDANNCWAYLSSIGDRKSVRDDCLNLAEANKINLLLDDENKTITFSYDGTINPKSKLQPNEKITFTLTALSNPPQRCVRIKTILGSLDQGKDNIECQRT